MGEGDRSWSLWTQMVSNLSLGSTAGAVSLNSRSQGLTYGSPALRCWIDAVIEGLGELRALKLTAHTVVRFLRVSSMSDSTA